MEEANTRDLLILTAERLFAQDGIGAVSLRRIAQAAGQKNASAPHYHFGSRETFIEAIFGRRMAGINLRRLEMLADVEAVGGAPDLHDCVEALILPLAERMDDGTGGTYYIRFLAQAYGDPTIDVAKIVRGKYDAGVRRVNTRITAILTDLPPDIVEQRLQSMARHAVYSLADRERIMAKPGGAISNTPVFVADLIDSIAGALAAPISRTTFALLTEANKQTA